MSQEIINKFKLRLEIIITCLGTEAEERYETVFSQGIFCQHLNMMRTNYCRKHL